MAVTPHSIERGRHYDTAIEGGSRHDKYCTISTLGSQGVTCDIREHYQVKFTGENWKPHLMRSSWLPVTHDKILCMFSSLLPVTCD